MGSTHSDIPLSLCIFRDFHTHTQQKNEAPETFLTLLRVLSLSVLPYVSESKNIPVSHTFTDEHGEFVFGPLCPGKEYAIDIWVNDVKHFKVCTKGHREGDCLKGKPHDKCDCFRNDKK